MKGIGRTIKRRRQSNQTDYTARLQLLTTARPRLVVRRTNRYLIAQLIKSDKAQDSVIVGVSSADLLAQGWPDSLRGSLKGIPAAYLTGLLLAHKAKNKVPEAILDLGMQRNTKGGRLYALVAGASAGGINIPHKKEIEPDNARLTSNTRTREAFIKVKEKLVHG